MKPTKEFLKDAEREALAEDIKTYLNTGGIISQHAHGESTYVGKKATIYEKKLHHDPSTKG